jgi:hypothetical protein
MTEKGEMIIWKFLQLSLVQVMATKWHVSMHNFHTDEKKQQASSISKNIYLQISIAFKK